MTAGQLIAIGWLVTFLLICASAIVEGRRIDAEVPFNVRLSQQEGRNHRERCSMILGAFAAWTIVVWVCFRG